MISIALCTYNGERFLQEQLDSIARQTLLPDELVVCDDCSADKTLEILKSYKARVPFAVHIHRNENNLGTIKNFEKAVQLCIGDIIAFCDQDDVWKPEKLQKIQEAFGEHPDAGYVFTDAEIVDETLDPHDYDYSLWESYGFTGPLIKKYISDQFFCLKTRYFVTGATMALRSKFKEFTMPYPTDRRWIHDGWNALILSAVGAYGVPMSGKLILYRQHKKQQKGASHPDKFKLKSPEKKSLWGQYKKIKDNWEASYLDWEKENDESNFLHDRLLKIKNNFTYDSEVFKKNRDFFEQLKIHISKRRVIFNDSGFKKYKLVLIELLSGRYSKFSHSWKSAVSDLILR